MQQALLLLLLLLFSIMLKINPKARDLVSCRSMISKNPTFGVFYGENPFEAPFSLLLLEMSLVILISRVVRLLLKPLRQPRVVSDVIVSFSLCLKTENRKEKRNKRCLKAIRNSKIIFLYHFFSFLWKLGLWFFIFEWIGF